MLPKGCQGKKSVSSISAVLQTSVSQRVGRGPLVGCGAFLVGRQAFLILLKIKISATNFMKIIKSLPYRLQKHP